MGACTVGLRGCCGHDARIGEYELGDMGHDASGLLTLTQKQLNNDALVKHVRTTSAKLQTLTEDYKDRIEQLEKAIRYAPVLRLKVISGSLLPGSILTVTAQGAEGGLRSSRDGIIYFGCKKRAASIPLKAKKGEIINDIVIKTKDKIIADKHRGRHCKIQYSLTTNLYQAKDLGIGFGTFAKLDQPLILQDNHLISMGESFFIISMVPNLSTDTSAKKDKRGSLEERFKRLRVKIYAGTANGEMFFFSPGKQAIKIGRLPSCEIQIEDNLMSKFQGHIIFSEEKGWILVDGYNGKPSTNGTWLYLSDEYNLYHGMILKANQTLFQVLLQ